MDEDVSSIDILIESDIDDGRNYIWGRPCIEIPQNEENYARYGGPMPWPPLPCHNWGYAQMNFDKETLIEMRIQGLMMFHCEKIIVVRQLWALENWEKWTKECEEKGIEPEAHLKIYDTLSKLKSAIQEMIIINLLSEIHTSKIFKPYLAINRDYTISISPKKREKYPTITSPVSSK